MLLSTEPIELLEPLHQHLKHFQRCLTLGWWMRAMIEVEMVVGERQRRCVFVNMRCIRCFRDGDGRAVSDGSGDQDLGNAGSKLLRDLEEFRASQKLVLCDGATKCQ
jgi:hypothetical protein